MRIALDEIGPLTAAMHRVLWAAVLLWVITLARGATLPKGLRLWFGFLVMGCLNNVIPFTLLSWGQLHIETGLTAILNAATAIWGVIVAAIVFADERLTPSRVIGVLIGFLGVATAVGLANFLSFDIRSSAQIAVLIATISYAVSGSWARARLTEVTPMTAATGMLTCSSLVLIPLATIVEGPPTLNLSGATIGAIVYYALISTALAYILYYRIIARAGAGNLLLVTLLLPPIAIVLGAIVRDEALTASAYVGFALLAVGLLILDGRVFRLRRAPTPTQG